jgi:hypothetical protein
MRSLTIGIVLIALGLPNLLLAQEPVLDLAITDLVYTCLPNGNSRLDAEVQLATADSIGAFAAEVRFIVDGIEVGSGFFEADSKPASSCEQLGPPCSDPINWCIPAIINGEVVEGDCFDVIEIDPPGGEGCLCIYLDWSPSDEWTPGKQSLVCTAQIDPDDNIKEIVEDNNSMTIIVGPSPARGTVWGTIKSLYR